MSAVCERVDRLEEALMRLAYIQQKTEIELQSFKKEMRIFKNEMSDFKEWSKKNIERLRQQTEAFEEWSKKQIGNLANRMGTLVEDIFAPSIDLALKKYFQATPTIVDTRKKVRIDGKSLELDILAVEYKTR